MGDVVDFPICDRLHAILKTVHDHQHGLIDWEQTKMLLMGEVSQMRRGDINDLATILFPMCDAEFRRHAADWFDDSLTP